MTVFLAAWVIGQFEEALDKIVALAVLMPVVASMGGIAGSQPLTLTVRGMALDQIARGNVRWLTIKELAVGALNGTVWAVVVAVVAYLWFHVPRLRWIWPGFKARQGAHSHSMQLLPQYRRRPAKAHRLTPYPVGTSSIGCHAQHPLRFVGLRCERVEQFSLCICPV